MKKAIFLVALFVGIFIAGCNENDLVKQIDGTWHVQNYSVNGADQTYWFDTTYAAFKWTFSGNINYHQSWNVVKKFRLFNFDTIAHYDTTTQTLVIDSITSSNAVVPTVVEIDQNGQWYLVNGNHFIQTQDSIFGNHQYQIISHSKNNLHLLDGNKNYYLSK
jgi:hypothetical protein